MFIPSEIPEQDVDVLDGAPGSTRESILQAAHECVQRFGIRRTTMEEVARRARLSRGAVYRYFPDKDTLVEAVLLRNGQRVRAKLDRALAEAPSFAGKLTVAAEFALSPGKDPLLLGLGEVEPEALALMVTVGAKPWMERATRFWETHVAAARQSGELRPDIEVAAAAEWVARSLYSLATSPSQSVDTRRPGVAAEFLVSFVMGGLGALPTRDQPKRRKT